MSMWQFIKAHPFYAVLAAILFFSLLYFPILLILLFLLGWIHETFFTKTKSKSIIEEFLLKSSIKAYTSSVFLDSFNNKYMSNADKQAYLLSPEWQALRQQVKARDKVCQLTGATDNLEVHHITYDNLGNEYLDDLVLLSRKAHQFVHDYYGSYDRNNTYPITEELRAAYVLSLLNNP